MYLLGVLWAYRNTPHKVTKEKPSFLLFGLDLKSPSEASLLPVSSMESSTVENYHEQVMVMLSSARSLAAANLKRSQAKSKNRYDQNGILFGEIGYWSSFPVMSQENTVSYPNPGIDHIVSWI